MEREDTPPLEAVAASSVAQGDECALGALWPVVYPQLGALARRFLASERAGHTLSPTALVHEAYLRLAEQRSVRWRSRAHVVALAAHMMRRVLVNHALAHRRAKRGQGWQRVTLDTGLQAEGAAPEQRALDLLEVDAALTRLSELDPQQARVVELRCFGGMTVDETAAALEVSPATVKRDWATARLWLLRELGQEPLP